MSCFWGHKWKYELVREIVLTMQRFLGRTNPIKIGEPWDETHAMQYRTCTKCGRTEDTRVHEYKHATD